MYSWVDNWGDVSTEFQSNWLKQHAADAKNVIKKARHVASVGFQGVHKGMIASPFLLPLFTLQPVIFEEWGKWLNLTANASLEDRTKFMAAAFADIEDIMSQPGAALQGR
jgi:hypothetical protein